MARKLAALAQRTYDVLVIGGGIIGAGVARDAALRGLSVLLVEQGDFASGTSSKTSKLIHGGVRYLEHGRFRLVVEATRERALLNRLAPHLVRPQTFLAPVYRGDRRGKLLLHLGLSLYDCLALWRTHLRHHCVSAPQVLALEPVLSPQALQGGALFSDSQMHDARLVLENILDACAHGAICENYVTVTALEKTDGRISGAQLRDMRTNESARITARCAVNATGPWSDVVRRLSDADAAPRLRPSRGIHLVMPDLGLKHLLLVAVPDGRVIFVQPWAGHTLIGTTDAEHTPNTPVRATAEEVAYLLAQMHRVLGGRQLSGADVIATYAGLRPLVAGDGALAQLSREHVLEEDRCGLLSLLGGKFTTYRALAELVTDRVCARLGSTGRCTTDQRPLFGGIVGDATQFIETHAQHALTQGLDRAAARQLVERYGVQSPTLFAWIADDAKLRPTLCPHHAHLAAEVRYAFEIERAQTLSDFLFRRTWMAYSPCHGRDALPRIEAVARAYVPELARRFEAEVRAVEAELAAMTAFTSTAA